MGSFNAVCAVPGPLEVRLSLAFLCVESHGSRKVQGPLVPLWVWSSYCLMQHWPFPPSPAGLITWSRSCQMKIMPPCIPRSARCKHIVLSPIHCCRISLHLLTEDILLCCSLCSTGLHGGCHFDCRGWRRWVGVKKEWNEEEREDRLGSISRKGSRRQVVRGGDTSY